MNTFTSQYSKDALEVINKTTQIAVNKSLELFEKNLDFAKKNADRSMAYLNSFQKISTLDDAVTFQKKVGEAEMAELQKTGESYCEFAEQASQEFISAAKQGSEIAEKSFGEVAQNAASILPNGKAVAFSDMMQQSAKTAGDFFQNGLDTAAQVARAGTDSVAKTRQTVGKAKNAKK